MDNRKAPVMLRLQPPKKNRAVRWLLIGVGAAAFFILLFVFAKAMISTAAPQGSIALITVTGEIGGSDGLLARPASPDELVAGIEQAEKDSRVKGIMVEINSPGGSPVASEEIMKAVKNAAKPTVALIRDVGASGAYWIASAADYVVASPVSLTGSVGVTASYLQFSGLLAKYGVGYERVVSGENKDIGSPYRNLTGEERAILQETVARMRDYFLSSVISNRQLSDNSSIRRISTALVFLGTEARDLGLVDELGGKKEAEGWLRQQTNLTEIKYVTYGKKPLFSLTDLIMRQSAEAGGAFGKSFLAGVFSAIPRQNVQT